MYYLRVNIYSVNAYSSCLQVICSGILYITNITIYITITTSPTKCLQYIYTQTNPHNELICLITIIQMQKSCGVKVVYNIARGYVRLQGSVYKKLKIHLLLFLWGLYTQPAVATNNNKSD